MAETAPRKEKSRFFGPIDTREEALKVVKESAIAFVVLGAISGSIALAMPQMRGLLWDAMLMILLAGALYQWKSRAAAVALLVLATLSAVVTVANMIGVMNKGGTNIVLALIVVWAAYRGVQATFALHRMGAANATSASSARR